MERTCKSCGVVKEIELFYKNSKCKFGFTHTCKACIRARMYHKRPKRLEWLSENKDRVNKIKKKYVNNNKDKRNETLRKHYANPKNRLRLNRNSKGWNQKQRDLLTDFYIKTEFGIKQPELINFKRKILKLKRIIHEKRKGRQPQNA